MEHLHMASLAIAARESSPYLLLPDDVILHKVAAENRLFSEFRNSYVAICNFLV